MSEKPKRVYGRPFKKGESGNPAGRPDGLPKVLRELSAKAYYDIVEELLSLSADQIKIIAEDPKQPAIRAIAASILHKGISQGDAGRLHFFLERHIGPVPQKIEHKAEIKSEVVYQSEWGLTNEHTDGQHIDQKDEGE